MGYKSSFLAQFSSHLFFITFACFTKPLKFCTFMQEIIMATHNAHKVKEILPLMPENYRLLSLQDIGFDTPIEEPFDTLEANAHIKAETIYKHTQRACFADDTGLEVEVLNGAPGVLSARYAGEQCSFEDNMQKLLQVMQGKINRAARFRTVIALIIKGEVYSFEGVVEGHIATERMGNKGFGYDPIFVPEGYDISFAQMPLAQKNTMSHRARATEKLMAFLKDYQW